MSPFRASAPLTDNWEHFQFSVAGGVGTVTLDRPGKLNALTFEAYADLRDLLAELPHRGDTRVLVVRGSGRPDFRVCILAARRGPAAPVAGPLTAPPCGGPAAVGKAKM
jgi:hypothetical protein